MAGAGSRGLRAGRRLCLGMLVFFSNRAGCLGSLLISLIGSVVLVLVMYACSGGGV